MAMPRNRASALAAVICEFPARKPAYITPTAMPSGMLCLSLIHIFWRKLMYKAFVRAKCGCDKWPDYEMSVAPYDKDKPIYYEFTSCPAAAFAVRHGLTNIMPALCNVDFASMELLRARLVRTNTCVDGCRCDYTICGDKDPYLKEHPEYRDEAGFRKNK